MECKITENAEHILLHCRKYREERIRLKQMINKTGRKLNLEGVLGTTGEGVKDAQGAVVEYLYIIGFRQQWGKFVLLFFYLFTLFI